MGKFLVRVSGENVDTILMGKILKLTKKGKTHEDYCTEVNGKI